MKATDLMIGDLLKDENNDFFQVAAIKGESGVIYDEYNDFHTEEDVKPIPLTPKILEKNGFVESYSGNTHCLNYHNYKDHEEDFDIYICDGIREGSTCEELKEYQITAIRYVHELQHILKLCKIDKEIEL